MKKVLLSVGFSLVIGGIFALVIYKNTNSLVSAAVSNTNTLSLFQVGVFKSEENAIDYMQNYNSSIIIKDQEYYRVIIGITFSDEATLLEKEYFESLNINFYIKEITIQDEQFLKKLEEYEQLLLNSSIETYNTINKNILKLYESSQNDEN